MSKPILVRFSYFECVTFPKYLRIIHKSTMTATIPSVTKVVLIPFDPESDEHVKRLYNQRVACGWNHHVVPKLAQQHREGTKGIHWITVSPLHPDCERLIGLHLAEYPNESIPLVDTAGQIFGRPRVFPDVLISELEAGKQEFIPIGHISLDTESPTPDLADPSKNTYTLTLLYISRALQASGLGSLSVRAIENLAVKDLNAKVLTLGTTDKGNYDNNEYWEAFGKARPKICNEDWYQRLGYGIFKYVDDHHRATDLTGREWTYRFVFLRKNIGCGNEVKDGNLTLA